MFRPIARVVSSLLVIGRYSSWRVAAALAAGLVPAERHTRIIETAIHWNYTSILNIFFLALAAILILRFLRTGGPDMLKMMDGPMREHHMVRD
jgi:hypothetical protein